MSSFRKNKRESNLTSNNLPEAFASVSVSAIRKVENRRDKSVIIKQLKKRNPNSRLFKAEGIPKPVYDFNQSNLGKELATLIIILDGSFPKIF